MADDFLDPYYGNVLTSGLGAILSIPEILALHTHLPFCPPSIGDVPRHVRLHFLMSIRNLHIPPLVERHLHQTVSLLVRQGYLHRNPDAPATWGLVSGQAPRQGILLPTACSGCVGGISGVGKTEACLRCLACIPQVIRHEHFPRLVGGLTQVTWQSVEVPPSGKAVDLARALMEAWEMTTGERRFGDWLDKDTIRDGSRALDEWRQVATSHFLGLLHLDEIQNLFKLQNLRQRKARKGAYEIPELSIVEDRTLRWILQLTNTAHIPLLVSGTPDGLGALSKRLSTLQRLNSFGYHEFNPIAFVPGQTPSGGPMMGVLGRYQYVKNPLTMDDEVVRLIIDLTAGVQRIIIALWIAAHRVAFERDSDDLRKEDFTTAATTWLAPLIPAVAALRSRDPNRMARYHDLVLHDAAFWTSFWGRAAAP
jgi:hypothetical protein